MSNAVKYCPNNGRIALLGHASDHELTVSVSDADLGLPPAEPDKIFEASTELWRGLAAHGGLTRFRNL